MADPTREAKFEQELCAALRERDWLHSKNDSGYDAARALYPADLIAWLRDSQGVAISKIEAALGAGWESSVLDRLCKAVASNPKGIIGVLRSTLDITASGTHRLKLFQARPTSGLNAELVDHYKKMRLRVMQQVHYSTKNRNCIDLVLFVNGIPLATLELKTDFKQHVQDAIAQYKADRNPGRPATGSEEVLLTFAKRALVHFAVSTDEIYMTTHLRGADTSFLPFNQGFDMGAGNPPNPASGYRTAYLWEKVLAKDSWIDLLDRYIQYVIETKEGPDGRAVEVPKVLFPRYHQWEAVNLLLETAKAEGAGKTYLIQHSAGSGKSNTIAWLAHALSELKANDDKAVFDGVIIVTDRNILDAQLGRNVEQFARQAGEVLWINDEEAAKSKALAEALKSGKRIIIVTLQTFPFVIKNLRDNSIAGRRYAVIADEAHSSQAGSSAGKLKEALGIADLPAPGPEADEDATPEDLLAEMAAKRGLPSNASFFAFTATPKGKTIELFGRLPNPKLPKSKDNAPRVFHLYTMKQAIEEEFILDVLRNYTPYEVAYRIATGGKEVDSKEVERKKALKQVASWVLLHPHNIAQKVAIIVEHFREKVAPMLNGKAKALVVTAGRKDAVRYKLAVDRYIREQGYTDVKALVAFSDEVEDPESGPGKFSETNMNPDLKGGDIARGLRMGPFNVLVVANKYQTGYDEPLLCAMYVDKELSGVATVQTFSRLNRIYPGKEKTYILDFRGNAEDVRKAFEPYYKATMLDGVSDPNLMLDLQAKLDAQNIYTLGELDQLAAAWLKGKGSQAGIISALTPAIERFRVQFKQARERKDEKAIERLELFRKDVGSFVSAYDFLSQIFRYDDSGLEKRYLFFKAFAPLIRDDNREGPIDLSKITLTHWKATAGETASIVADGTGVVKPLIDLGSGKVNDRERARLGEIIARINALFEGELTDNDKVQFTMGIVNRLAEDENVLQQAEANDKEAFAHGDFRDKVRDAIADQVESHKDIGRQVLSKEKFETFVELLADLAHDKLREKARGIPPRPTP